MERARTIALVGILVVLALLILRLESRARSLGTQLDAIHQELRTVNHNLEATRR